MAPWIASAATLPPFETLLNALQEAEAIFGVQCLCDARAGDSLSEEYSLKREKEWKGCRREALCDLHRREEDLRN